MNGAGGQRAGSDASSRPGRAAARAVAGAALALGPGLGLGLARRLRPPAGEASRSNSRSLTGSNLGSQRLGGPGESAAAALGHGPAARGAQLLIGLRLYLGEESSSAPAKKSFLCET